MAKSTIKFRDSVAAFEALGRDIDAKKFSPVYLLMGEESYFIDALSDRLADEILSEAEKAFNRTVVYGKDSDVGAIINTARQMPMMGSWQVVVVREAQQLRKLEDLQLYTSNPSPSTILVLCHKEKNLDKRTALFKHASSKGVVFESVRPRDYEIREWLSDFIRRRGLQPDVKAVEMLTEFLGTNLAKISGELSKLVLSLPEGTTKLTPEDVERNTGFSRDFNNFELCKAVATRNLPRALTIADHFARNPKEHPLLVSILSLFGHFKEIFVINYLSWQSRRRGTPMPPDTELMSLLRLPSPFLVGELKKDAALWSNKITFRVLGLLREYDAKSKGMNSGGAGDGELLRELLLKMFSLR